MKFIWSTEQKEKAQSQYPNIIWNQFKTGTKNRTLHIPLLKFKQYEYIIQYEFDKEAELNEI